MGVYRGWSSTGGERALRVVNGEDHRQSMGSGLTSPTTIHARDSVLSELESPTTPRRAAGRSLQPTVEEQPFELPGREERG